MKRDIHSSGFKSLDKLIGGFNKGELVLIAGLPAVGVTQLLINLAIAFTKKVPVFYFTPNYLHSGIINRLKSSLSQIPMETFVRKNLTCDDVTKITAVHLTTAFNRIHLHDSDADSMGVLKGLRQMLIDEGRLELIIVDNLQDLCYSTIESKFIQELKSIAEEFRVTVILASDINKRVETRKDKAPKLKDVSKRNLIPELCDKIIFVHRPDRYSNQVELIIAKNVNGNIGSVALTRDESLTNIIDWVRVS